MTDGFSQEWDELYKGGAHLSVWPWTDLVRAVMRYARPKGESFRVLDLGCGAGANIEFFLSLGVEYFGIEGSPTIVEKLHQKYPNLEKQIVVADFTSEIPFAGNFDVFVDRGSLTHNSTSAIRRSLDLIKSQMNESSRFIGIDWMSTKHSDYPRGKDEEDIYTKSGFTEGHLAGTGIVHFADREHLNDLFADFSFLSIEHKVLQHLHPEKPWQLATWNFVAEPKK